MDITFSTEQGRFNYRVCANNDYGTNGITIDY